MANPLQPKCIKVLENEYGAYVVKVVRSSKSGEGDLIVCIKGLYYMFEIKYKADRPSELQKAKINKCIDAGGKAYFVKSVDQLRDIIDNKIPPAKYEFTNKLTL